MYAADAHCQSTPGDCPGSSPLDWGTYSQEIGLVADRHPIIVVVYSGKTRGRQKGLALGADFWYPLGYPYPVPHDLDDGSYDWRVGVAVVSETTECHFEAPQIIYESTKGVYTHEMLHAFGGPIVTNTWASGYRIPGGKMGIADLYDDYTNFEELLGIEWIPDGADDFIAHWALMGDGINNPPPPRGLSGELEDPDAPCSFTPSEIGQYPSYPSSYTQIRLGWLDEGDPAQVYPANPPAAGEGTVTHTVVIRPLEIDPDTDPCPGPADIPCTRAVKVPIDDNDQVYYLLEVRKFEGSDQGLPDEGVIILAVDESKWSGAGIVRVRDDTPDVTIPGCQVGGPTYLNPLGDATWTEDQTYEAPDIEGLTIAIDQRFPDSSYQVTVTYPPAPRPDVVITDWSPPVYQTVDIWIDSNCANDWGVYDPDADLVGNRDPLCLEHPNHINARIRNDGEVMAHDVTARFYWAPFGAGQMDDWHFIDKDTHDVGTTDSVDFMVIWDSPHGADLSAAGVSHFCLRVDVSSENDMNPGNQAAQENINYVHPESAVNDKFAVTNPMNKSKFFYFQIDPQPPEGWTVELLPGGRPQNKLRLDAHEHELVDIKIVPPVDFRQRKTFNVTVLTYLGDVLGAVGGVSYDVSILEPAEIDIVPGPVNAKGAIVTGHLTPPRGRARVALRYTLPDGSRIDRKVFTNAGGLFTDQIDDPMLGSWFVCGSWPGDLTYGAAKTADVQFDVRSAPPVVSLSRFVVYIVIVAAVLVIGAYFLRRRKGR